jgi:hypothetical protein
MPPSPLVHESAEEPGSATSTTGPTASPQVQ